MGQIIICSISGLIYLYVGYIFGYYNYKIWHTDYNQHFLIKKILWPVTFIGCRNNSLNNFVDDTIISKFGKEEGGKENYCYVMAFVWPLKIIGVVVTFIFILIVATIYHAYHGFKFLGKNFFKILFYPLRKLE